MKLRALFGGSKLPDRAHGGAGSVIRPGSRDFPPRPFMPQGQGLPVNNRQSAAVAVGPRNMASFPPLQHPNHGPMPHQERPFAGQQWPGHMQGRAPDPFNRWVSQGSLPQAHSSTASAAARLNERNFGPFYGAVVTSAEHEFDKLSGALSTPGDRYSFQRISIFNHRLNESRKQIHPPGSLATDPAQKRALAQLNVLQQQVDSAMQGAAFAASGPRQASTAQVAKTSAVLKKTRAAVESPQVLKERERRALVGRMFPDGIQNARIYQGDLGNCKYVSTFLAMCLHQPQRIDSMIQVGRRPGEVKVVMDKRAPVYVDLNKFEGLAMRGDVGSQVFERVFAHNQKTLASRSSTQIMSKINTMENVWKDFVPGHHRNFFIPTWRNRPNGPLQVGRFPPAEWNDIERTLQRMARDPSGMLGTFSLKPQSMCDRPLVDIQGQALSTRGKHAFAIVQVDEARRLMLLCDPKIPGSRQWLSIDEAFHVGSSFDVVNLRGN